MNKEIESQKEEGECLHEEHDHYVCIDCGAELDPGEFIDAAEYDMER